MEIPESNKPANPPISRQLTNAELKNMWNLVKIAANLGTKEQCIKFAEECGLIPRTRMCGRHKVPMSLLDSGPLGSFTCRRGKCRDRTKISRTKGTWFERSKMPPTLIFYVMYGYAHHWPFAMLRLENILDGPSLSSATIVDWYNTCRQAVVRYYIEKQDSVGKIGGTGNKVQVDEIKFGKSETSKAKSMEGKWVLGMIEDDSDDLRLEICCVDESPEEVLLPLIKKHVIKGTVIRTEFHQLENTLQDHGYFYQAAGRNKQFEKKLSESEKIDGDWRVSKRFYHKDNFNNPDNYAEMIVEYAWRRAISRKRADPFVELVKAAKHSFRR